MTIILIAALWFASLALVVFLLWRRGNRIENAARNLSRHGHEARRATLQEKQDRVHAELRRELAR